jgi:hypothetical protein
MYYQKKNFDLSPKLKWGVGRGRSFNHLLKLAGGAFLLVALTLTANAARLVYRQAMGSNNPEPQVLGASDTTATDQVQFIEYKVQKGDTLFNISQQHNISWTILATLNKLDIPFILSPGQSIKIPKQ